MLPFDDVVVVNGVTFLLAILATVDSSSVVGDDRVYHASILRDLKVSC